MSKDVKFKECQSAMAELAETACIVVAAETAYDITDSLKTSPDQYPTYFYDLARLAAKLLREVEKAIKVSSTSSSKNNILEKAREKLLSFRGKLEKVISCLENLDNEERRRLILQFTALTVAPDQFAYKVVSELHGEKSS